MIEIEIENYGIISEYENKECERIEEKKNFEAKESEVISSYIVGTIIESALNQLGIISWNFVSKYCVGGQMNGEGIRILIQISGSQKVDGLGSIILYE